MSELKRFIIINNLAVPSEARKHSTVNATRGHPSI